MKNFPHVYYFTLSNRRYRQIYMENQFENFGIKYSKIAMGGDNDKNILKKLKKGHSDGASLRCLAYNCYLLETLKKWYFESKEEHIIIMEDDYDLQFIDLWHFSWEELIDRLPYDWDCLQMGFECPDKVRFYLHPIQPNYSLGPSLLKREYVEKLLDIFCDGEKYTFKGTVANSIYLNRDSGIGDNKFFVDLGGTPDYFICQNGKTYSLPLIPCNPLFEGSTHKGEWYPMMTFIFCYEAYLEWWKNDKDNFSLDEFFSYGKSNDILMERDITRWEPKYFEEKYKILRQTFLLDYEKYIFHPTTI